MRLRAAVITISLLALLGCEVMRRSHEASRPPSIATTAEVMASELAAHHEIANHAEHKVRLLPIVCDEEDDEWLVRRMQAQIIAASARAGLDLDLPSRLNREDGERAYVMTCAIRYGVSPETRTLAARLDRNGAVTDEPAWSGRYLMTLPPRHGER